MRIFPGCWAKSAVERNNLARDSEVAETERFFDMGSSNCEPDRIKPERGRGVVYGVFTVKGGRKGSLAASTVHPTDASECWLRCLRPTRARSATSKRCWPEPHAQQ